MDFLVFQGPHDDLERDLDAARRLGLPDLAEAARADALDQPVAAADAKDLALAGPGNLERTWRLYRGGVGRALVRQVALHEPLQILEVFGKARLVDRQRRLVATHLPDVPFLVKKRHQAVTVGRQ